MYQPKDMEKYHEQKSTDETNLEIFVKSFNLKV